jgi:hypothetical protein
MAIAGNHERLGHLEPHRPAVAATRERELGHRQRPGGRLQCLLLTSSLVLYSRDLEDPDGNIVAFQWMAPQAAEQGPEAYLAAQAQV